MVFNSEAQTVLMHVRKECQGRRSRISFLAQKPNTGYGDIIHGSTQPHQ
jgi:hypothetical protein